MTRKDFTLIAEVLAQAMVSADAIGLGTGTIAYLIEQFADKLATTNPRFDRDRFIRAASAASELT